MAMNKAFGPVLTLVAVATLGGGTWLTNLSQGGDSIELWLRGRATNGKLALWINDTTSRLDGHLDGNATTGTLGIGKQAWDFTAAPVVGADDDN
jgi:hypothetical protein